MTKQSIVFHDTEMNKLYNYVKNGKGIDFIHNTFKDNSQFVGLYSVFNKATTIPPNLKPLFNQAHMHIIDVSNSSHENIPIPDNIITSDNRTTFIILPPLCAEIPQCSCPLTITKINGDVEYIKANDCFSQCIMLRVGEKCTYGGEQLICSILYMDDDEKKDDHVHNHMEPGIMDIIDQASGGYISMGMSEIGDLIETQSIRSTRHPPLRRRNAMIFADRQRVTLQEAVTIGQIIEDDIIDITDDEADGMSELL